MTTCKLLCTVGCILALAVGCSKVPERQPVAVTKEADRPLSQFTAKQAFARLALYLRSHGEAAVDKLWYVAPEFSGVHDGGRSLLVGGWVLTYETSQQKIHTAHVNCWGEVREAPAESIRPNLSSPIPLSTWILDSSDALAVAVDRGSAWYAVHPSGGVLLVLSITKRGKRPVWGDEGNLFLADGALPEPIWVDAETGEIYTIAKADQYVPISSSSRALNEWAGTFDKGSADAIQGRSEYPQFWPYAYFREFYGQFVYNRHLLRAELKNETTKSNRDASSWQTSGTIAAVLGNWLRASDDLDQAVKMQPDNGSYRLERAIVHIAIRDFDVATSDLQALPSSLKGPAEDSTRMIALLQGRLGEIKRKSDSAFGGAIKTSLGCIPLQIPIGPTPIVRPAGVM